MLASSSASQGQDLPENHPANAVSHRRRTSLFTELGGQECGEESTTVTTHNTQEKHSRSKDYDVASPASSSSSRDTRLSLSPVLLSSRKTPAARAKETNSFPFSVLVQGEDQSKDQGVDIDRQEEGDEGRKLNDGVFGLCFPSSQFSWSDELRRRYSVWSVSEEDLNKNLPLTQLVQSPGGRPSRNETSVLSSPTRIDGSSQAAFRSSYNDGLKQKLKPSSPVVSLPCFSTKLGGSPRVQTPSKSVTQSQRKERWKGSPVPVVLSEGIRSCPRLGTSRQSRDVESVRITSYSAPPSITHGKGEPQRWRIGVARRSYNTAASTSLFTRSPPLRSSSYRKRCLRRSDGPSRWHTGGTRDISCRETTTHRQATLQENEGVAFRKRSEGCLHGLGALSPKPERKLPRALFSASQNEEKPREALCKSSRFLLARDRTGTSVRQDVDRLQAGRSEDWTPPSRTIPCPGEREKVTRSPFKRSGLSAEEAEKLRFHDTLEPHVAFTYARRPEHSRSSPSGFLFQSARRGKARCVASPRGRSYDFEATDEEDEGLHLLRTAAASFHDAFNALSGAYRYQRRYTSQLEERIKQLEMIQNQQKARLDAFDAYTRAVYATTLSSTGSSKKHLASLVTSLHAFSYSRAFAPENCQLEKQGQVPVIGSLDRRRGTFRAEERLSGQMSSRSSPSGGSGGRMANEAQFLLSPCRPGSDENTRCLNQEYIKKRERGSNLERGASLLSPQLQGFLRRGVKSVSVCQKNTSGRLSSVVAGLGCPLSVGAGEPSDVPDTGKENDDLQEAGRSSRSSAEELHRRELLHCLTEKRLSPGNRLERGNDLRQTEKKKERKNMNGVEEGEEWKAIVIEGQTEVVLGEGSEAHSRTRETGPRRSVLTAEVCTAEVLSFGERVRGDRAREGTDIQGKDGERTDVTGDGTEGKSSVLEQEGREAPGGRATSESRGAEEEEETGKPNADGVDEKDRRVEAGAEDRQKCQLSHGRSAKRGGTVARPTTEKGNDSAGDVAATPQEPSALKGVRTNSPRSISGLRHQGDEYQKFVVDTLLAGRARVEGRVLQILFASSLLALRLGGASLSSFSFHGKVAGNSSKQVPPVKCSQPNQDDQRKTGSVQEEMKVQNGQYKEGRVTCGARPDQPLREIQISSEKKETMNLQLGTTHHVSPSGVTVKESESKGEKREEHSEGYRVSSGKQNKMTRTFSCANVTTDFQRQEPPADTHPFRRMPEFEDGYLQTRGDHGGWLVLLKVEAIDDEIPEGASPVRSSDEVESSLLVAPGHLSPSTSAANEQQYPLGSQVPSEDESLLPFSATSEHPEKQLRPISHSNVIMFGTESSQALSSRLPHVSASCEREVERRNQTPAHGCADGQHDFTSNDHLSRAFVSPVSPDVIAADDVTRSSSVACSGLISPGSTSEHLQRDEWRQHAEKIFPACSLKDQRRETCAPTSFCSHNTPYLVWCLLHPEGVACSKCGGICSTCSSRHVGLPADAAKAVRSEDALSSFDNQTGGISTSLRLISYVPVELVDLEESESGSPRAPSEPDSSSLFSPTFFRKSACCRPLHPHTQVSCFSRSSRFPFVPRLTTSPSNASSVPLPFFSGSPSHDIALYWSSFSSHLTSYASGPLPFSVLPFLLYVRSCQVSDCLSLRRKRERVSAVLQPCTRDEGQPSPGIPPSPWQRVEEFSSGGEKEEKRRTELPQDFASGREDAEADSRVTKRRRTHRRGSEVLGVVSDKLTSPGTSVQTPAHEAQLDQLPRAQHVVETEALAENRAFDLQDRRHAGVKNRGRRTQEVNTGESKVIMEVNEDTREEGGSDRLAEQTPPTNGKKQCESPEEKSEEELREAEGEVVSVTDSDGGFECEPPVKMKVSLPSRRMLRKSAAGKTARLFPAPGAAFAAPDMEIVVSDEDKEENQKKKAHKGERPYLFVGNTEVGSLHTEKCRILGGNRADVMRGKGHEEDGELQVEPSTCQRSEELVEWRGVVRQANEIKGGGEGQDRTTAFCSPLAREARVSVHLARLKEPTPCSRHAEEENENGGQKEQYRGTEKQHSESEKAREESTSSGEANALQTNVHALPPEERRASSNAGENKEGDDRHGGESLQRDLNGVATCGVASCPTKSRRRSIPQAGNASPVTENVCPDEQPRKSVLLRCEPGMDRCLDVEEQGVPCPGKDDSGVIEKGKSSDRGGRNVGGSPDRWRCSTASAERCNAKRRNFRRKTRGCLLELHDDSPAEDTSSIGRGTTHCSTSHQLRDRQVGLIYRQHIPNILSGKTGTHNSDRRCEDGMSTMHQQEAAITKVLPRSAPSHDRLLPKGCHQACYSELHCEGGEPIGRGSSQGDTEARAGFSELEGEPRAGRGVLEPKVADPIRGGPCCCPHASRARTQEKKTCCAVRSSSLSSSRCISVTDRSGVGGFEANASSGKTKRSSFMLVGPETASLAPLARAVLEEGTYEKCSQNSNPKGSSTASSLTCPAASGPRELRYTPVRSGSLCGLRPSLLWSAESEKDDRSAHSAKLQKEGVSGGPGGSSDRRDRTGREQQRASCARMEGTAGYGLRCSAFSALQRRDVAWGKLPKVRVAAPDRITRRQLPGGDCSQCHLFYSLLLRDDQDDEGERHTENAAAGRVVGDPCKDKAREKRTDWHNRVRQVVTEEFASDTGEGPESFTRGSPRFREERQAMRHLKSESRGRERGGETVKDGRRGPKSEKEASNARSGDPSTLICLDIQERTYTENVKRNAVFSSSAATAQGAKVVGAPSLSDARTPTEGTPTRPRCFLEPRGAHGGRRTLHSHSHFFEERQEARGHLVVAREEKADSRQWRGSKGEAIISGGGGRRWTEYRDVFQASRHKHFAPFTSTPPGFWDFSSFCSPGTRDEGGRTD